MSSFHFYEEQLLEFAAAPEKRDLTPEDLAKVAELYYKNFYLEPEQPRPPSRNKPRRPGKRLSSFQFHIKPEAPASGFILFPCMDEWLYNETNFTILIAERLYDIYSNKVSEMLLKAREI